MNPQSWTTKHPTIYDRLNQTLASGKELLLKLLESFRKFKMYMLNSGRQTLIRLHLQNYRTLRFLMIQWFRINGYILQI